MRDGRNLRKHELIGLRIRIVESSDPSLMGLSGRIVDETKNMIRLDVNGNEKSVPKKAVKLRFDDYDVIIDGAKIAYRPEDRIKKVRS